MADNVDIKRRFVQLRGQGKSYSSISKELGVSERTLVRWSRKLAHQIANQRTLEFEKLREEYLLNRQQRLRIAGSQLNRITEELLKRDLSEEPAHRLFDIQQKLLKDVCDDSEKMEFAEEVPADDSAAFRNVFNKVLKWRG